MIKYHFIPPFDTLCCTTYPEVRLPNPPVVGAAEAPVAVGVTLEVDVPDAVTLVVDVPEEVTEVVEVFVAVVLEEAVEEGVREALAEAVSEEEEVEVDVIAGELVREDDQEGEGVITDPYPP